MRLSFKITLFFIGGICLVMAWYGLERIERETALFEDQMRRDHYAIAQPLAVIIARAWEDFGEDFAHQLVENSNDADERTRIRWVSVHRDGVERIRPEAPDDAGARLAQGMAVSWIDRDQIRAGRLYTYVPVVAEGSRIGAIEISESFEHEREYVEASKRRILQTTVLILMIATVVAWGTGILFIARPVEALVEKARAIGRGELKTPLELKGQHELSYLAREMNLMGEELAKIQDQLHSESAARLKAMRELRHADRLKTVGTLAAGIAHELGTPLNVISMRAEILQYGEVSPEEVHRNAGIIADQSERITAIIRQLMDFARTRPLRTEEVSLASLVDEGSALLAPLAAKKNVTIEAGEIDDEVRADVDPDQLIQVVTNLLVNAMQACEENGGGRIMVSISLVERIAPDDERQELRTFAALEIADTGPGIDEEAQEKLFEPFFTTKPVGEGTGLGLSVSYGIVTEHGGWIEVESTPGEGATFTVVLPRKEEQ